MAAERASVATSSVLADGVYTLRLVLLVGSLLSIISYAFIFVSASYLSNVPLDAAVSFWSNDFPRPLPVSAYPSPAGHHFFGDFLVTFRLAQQPSPYLAEGYVPFGYLPMSAVLLGPLTPLGYWWALAIFLLVCITLLFLAIWKSFSDSDKVTPTLVIALVLLSGPFMNGVDRGNVGLLMVGLMCLGASAELSGRRILSGVLFGVAAAMKLYPAFLGSVFLHRTRIKTMLTMAATTVVCVVVPVVVFAGGWWTNLSVMKDQFVGSSNFAHAERIHAFNNSFFALFHAMEMSEVSWVNASGSVLVENYYLVIVVVALISLAVALHPRISNLSRYICSCVTMVFLPNIVGSYVLMIMIIPLLIGCAVISRDRSSMSRLTLTQVVLLVVILVPKGLPFPNPLAVWSQAESTFSSVLNPLLGLVLLTVSVIEFIRISVRKKVDLGGGYDLEVLHGADGLI